MHQDLDCRWPVDTGCSEHDGTIGHSDVEGQARHGRIAAYQTQIAQAKHDLAHINASIRLFTDPEHQRARYMVSHGFFKKGEIADICIRHLRIDGELTTRELAERVMIERRLDATDTTLRNSVVFKVSKPYVTRPGASWSVWWRSAKACATGQRATPSRCASLPIAGPRPADRSGKHIKDQPIHQHAITFLAMVFKPGGVNGIGAEIFAAHRVMLAADHAA